MESQESFPLPEDPVLAEAAAALRDTGQWGWVIDDRWRLVYATDELRLTFGGNVELAPFAIGSHLFGPEQVALSLSWRNGSNTIEFNRMMLAGLGGLVLADTPGGRDALRELVHPELRDLVDDLTPSDRSVLSYVAGGQTVAREHVSVPSVATRLRDHSGRLAGTFLTGKPAPGMATLAAMTAGGDVRHFVRMMGVARPARRPAAILFADLEASSPLAKRLSTASYFALGRRLVRAADQCIIDAGGLAGRHVGDGVVAFFLAESAGSESAAARDCIAASRALRETVSDVAAATSCPRTSCCASACTGARRSTSGRS